MPPQNQRRSSSAEDLDEYLKFQQGQQAKQAMSLQQLGAMFNMSQQQVANEIARANLEIARSGQGIAQGRLDLDIASNPSIIAARAAEAAYNQAKADGYAEEQASLIAYRAAQTAQTKVLTAGQSITNAINQRSSDSQDTEIEQKIRAGEAEIALKDAQRQGVVVSTKDLEARYPYLADEYRLKNQLAQAQVDASLYNTDYILPANLRNLTLAGDAAVQLFNRNPAQWSMADALTSAQTASTAANANAQVLANEDLPRRIDQDKAAAAVQLQLGGSQLATQGYNNIWQDLQNQNAPKLFGNQDALAKAQIQNIRATTGFGAFDRGLVNGMQAAELTVDPSYYDKYIRPIHEFKAKERETTRLADEARQAQSQVKQTFKVADQPADLQSAYAEEMAQVDAFYKDQQIKQKQIEANRVRNASLHQLNLMRFSDTFDPGSSY